jgi:hypothetical protein
MMEPLRGSEALTKALLDSADTAAALIEALGATDIETVYPEPGW